MKQNAWTSFPNSLGELFRMLDTCSQIRAIAREGGYSVHYANILSYFLGLDVPYENHTKETRVAAGVL